MAMLTREDLQLLIDGSFGPAGEVTNKTRLVIGRALVVLFKNQTATEKQVNTTQEHNNIGFTGADAWGGSLTAKYFIKHGTLLDWQVLRWTKNCKNGQSRLTKYWKQLNEAAKAKARAELEV